MPGKDNKQYKPIDFDQRYDGEEVAAEDKEWIQSHIPQRLEDDYLAWDLDSLDLVTR